MEWYRDKIFPFDNETVDFVRYKIIYATLVVEFLKLLLVALLFPKIAYTVEKNRIWSPNYPLLCKQWAI